MAAPFNRACGAIIVACLIAGWTQVARATDISQFDVITPAAPQKPEWAGSYLRSNGGFGPDGAAWTSLGNSAVAFPPPGTVTHPFNENFGYNFQSGSFVFGLEGALAGTNFDGRGAGSPYLQGVAGWSPNMNWLGTVTGRVGWSFGQWMPYVKGGFAAAEIGSPLQTSPVTGFSQSTSERNGWTAGVGVEYQMSNKWSLGLEYLYTDLNGGSSFSGSGPEVYSTAVKSQSILGRLNYKAGW